MSLDLDHYQARLIRLHRELGISPDYAAVCGMPLQPECRELVETETDVFGRQPLMMAPAFQAWRGMKAAALEDAVELQIVSAFRSVDYQGQLIAAKLGKGMRIDEILKVNAAPGYSEHHSGAALDIGCPGVEHLSEAFEHSAAFRWLAAHAGEFGFRMSFGRDNPFGVMYEPWHWCWSADGHAKS